MKEFDDKKVELKENLIAELEEKKKMIENEKLTMELTGGKRARAGLLIRHLFSKRGRNGETKRMRVEVSSSFLQTFILSYLIKVGLTVMQDFKFCCRYFCNNDILDDLTKYAVELIKDSAMLC